MMRMRPLLAVALLALGSSSLALSQQGLPGDWEKKVAAVVPEAERARNVSEAGRKYDAARQVSLDAMKASAEDVKTAFFSQASSVGERQLSVGLLGDDRRMASMAAVDALFRVRFFVSKKEWSQLWPEGYFAPAGLPPLMAGRLQKALPSVVTDPARLKQAEGVVATLTAAAKKDESARLKATDKFWKLLENYDSRRDEFIDLVNTLEETQVKADNAFVGSAGDLQRILTPDEWTALMRQLSPAP